MPQKRSNLLLWIIVGGGALFFFVLCLLALATIFTDESSPGLSLSTTQVAVLDVEGVISDSRDFVDQLKEYGNRSGVKSVVIRIDSPGGGVAASQEMYEAIKKFRASTKKKVVVSMASTAASGGYYIACAADKIFANQGTITGSIGVIAQWYNYGDLLRWAKMQDVVIKSGSLKDAGSGSRPLTEAEKIYFQSLISSMYGQFVSAVASSRNMKEADVRLLADGRVFTGQEAKANRLIDEIGTFQDAVKAAAEMAGIQGEPKLLSPAKKSFSLMDLVLGDSGAALKSLNPNRSESHIRFEYLWR
jgi:protease IV